MRDEDVKIGMIVKIKSKLQYDFDSGALFHILKNSNQNYAYVSKINPGTNPIIYSLSEKKGGSGDFFICEDFEPGIKEERKIKLLQIMEPHER